jgi:hypothetical protein
MTAYPKSRTTSKTWDAIWQKLVHAFNNLQQGSKDDSIMMGGWKAVIWQLEGDHEYFQMFSNFHIGKKSTFVGSAWVIKQQVLISQFCLFPIQGCLMMKWAVDYPIIGFSEFLVFPNTMLLMTAFMSFSLMALSIMLWAMLSNIGAGKALKGQDKLLSLR